MGLISQLLVVCIFVFSIIITTRNYDMEKRLELIAYDVAEIKKQEDNLKNIIGVIKLNSEASLHALLAEKVERIVRDKNTTEEKVIALAQWVSSNISNNEEFGNNVYTWFSNRSGLCGMRAVLFVEMLKYINVRGEVYNICKFPARENAHSCAQVYYDGQWHFFDVTYAGYFKMNDKILSFDEMVSASKKQDILEHLVVFEKNLDRSRSLSTRSYHTLPSSEFVKATNVNNLERMKYVYARENLMNAKEYGKFEPELGPCPL
jgi:hypothetical protein